MYYILSFCSRTAAGEDLEFNVRQRIFGERGHHMLLAVSRGLGRGGGGAVNNYQYCCKGSLL